MSKWRSTVSAIELGRVEVGVRAICRRGGFEAEVGALTLGSSLFGGLEGCVIEGICDVAETEVLGIGPVE